MDAIKFQDKFMQLQQNTIASGVKNSSSPAQNSALEGADKGKNSFLDYLKDNVKEVNEYQKNADTMTTGLASGEHENIHETMLALTQAEISFNLMVQIRNKALEAYQEIMRMPV